MCEYKGEDVEQVPALFESAKQVETSTYALQQLEEGASALPTTATLTGASSETPSTTRSPLLEPMTKRARMDKDSIETIRARDQPDTASETSQADDQESDVSDTLESQVADDEMLDTLNDDGDEDPEDDETARQALTYMLQHFGPDL
ncbi:hypothetical protein DM01DRAFT_349426 [Hesseltinella vesiculosa]|uniref:Uncharacterized protein n=1 Tax=Hesseltinella vesiculosa TaxID=101127 RepID=A0A1X2GWR1_9FUNG|nr:hypothetical protein DM01DRAFT_349426 [Hesseltinella vesiculosa]